METTPKAETTSSASSTSGIASSFSGSTSSLNKVKKTNKKWNQNKQHFSGSSGKQGGYKNYQNHSIPNKNKPMSGNFHNQNRHLANPMSPPVALPARAGSSNGTATSHTGHDNTTDLKYLPNFSSKEAKIASLLNIFKDEPPKVPTTLSSNHPPPKTDSLVVPQVASGANLSDPGLTLPVQKTEDQPDPNKSNLSVLELFRKYQQDKADALAQQASGLKLTDKKPKPVFDKHRVPRAILEQTRLLPIYSQKEKLIELIKANQFVIVTGETGCGKSTQLPQYLAEAGLHGRGMIGVTQPRRVAAKSLADRVALECGTKSGKTVGYAVRFDKKVSSDTIIKYLTDGMLVRECVSEPNLDSYSIVIVDEAHERRVHTDLCFGLLKRAAKLRPELKVIISSATLEQDKMSQYFNNAPIFEVSGKGFDVEVEYHSKGEFDYMQGAVDLIVTINKREPRGDILVFLPGQEEIEKVWDLLVAKLRDIPSSLDDEIWIVPCYSGLSLEEQQQNIFTETPPNSRKVVLATNIAETSLTIEGIVHVIDCGYFKQNEYNPRSGISSLVSRRITKFHAIQRAGRAGRTRAGKCYRLYPEYEFNLTMKHAPNPEVTRCNVESVVLDIISMGIENPLDFEFMDSPPLETMMEAIEHLQELSALDATLKLTEIGKRMSGFPLDPPLAKVVLESEKLGCTQEVLKIVAILSTQYNRLFSGGKGNREKSRMAKANFDELEGDQLTFLKVYDSWVKGQRNEAWCKQNLIQHHNFLEAEEIREQLKDECRLSQGKRFQGPLSQNIRRAFTAGYFRQLAKKKLKGHGYELVAEGTVDEVVFLHPTSSLFNVKPPWVIFHQVTKTEKAYMTGVIAIEPGWITEYAPEFAKKVARYGVPAPI